MSSTIRRKAHHLLDQTVGKNLKESVPIPYFDLLKMNTLSQHVE